MDKFNDFFDAFDAEAVSVTEETPATEEVQETEESGEASEAAEDSAEENTESTEAQEGKIAGDKASEGETPDADAGSQEQVFTVGDQQYSLEEMTELARKGSGYDALQNQLNEAEQARDQLQTVLDGQQSVMDILSQIAQQSGKTIQDLAKQMYVNFRKSAGLSEDAAALELENVQLKKQMDAGKTAQQQEIKAADDAKARAKQEIAEFRKLYPGVAIDQALAAKLKTDVANGMSLVNAYQKMLNERKAAELAEQQRKIDADKQNEKNKRNSPGSQQDSGGRQEKGRFDDFFSQFK